MEKNTPPANQFALNPLAPEIYVSGLMRADIEWGGIVKLAFATLHYSEDGKQQHQTVNLRVVMGVGAAQGMLTFLNDWLPKMLAAPAPPEAIKH